MFGYACHAARKSAVFETMFWLASSTISLRCGLFVLRYQATWQMRS